LKALRIAGIAFAALVTLAAAIFAWAGFSESGTRALLALSRGWLPAGVTVGEVNGTVAGSLRVRHFRYRDTSIGMDLAIDEAVLETAALALLRRRLHIERARVEGLRLELFAPTTPGPPPGARDPWVAPLDLRVDDLRLTRGELRRADTAPFVARMISACFAGRLAIANSRSGMMTFA